MNFAFLFFFFVFIGIIIFINFLEKFRKLKIFSFILLGIFLILFGFFLIYMMIIENSFTYTHLPYPAIFFTLGIFSFLLYSEKFRKNIIKIFRLNLNSKSTIHCFAIFLFFSSLIAGIFHIIYNENLMNYENLHIEDVVINELFYAAIAFAGYGIFIRRNFRETLKVLGLKKVKLNEIFIGISVGIFLIFFSGIIGWIFHNFFNQPSENIEWIKNLINFQNIFIIGISAGVCEEILFRGALQPKFGIFLSSILFAILHVQYNIPWILLTIFIISVTLGYLRKFTNTTTSIIAHSTFDGVQMTILFFAASGI